MDVWAAGDAQEIAEASAALFSGRIQASQAWDASSILAWRI